MPDLEKIWINLKSVLIFNKKARKKYRTQCIKRLNNRRSEAAVGGFMWGVSYSVFDGFEILEASLRSVRAHVDYINVVYQRCSWYGDPADETMLPHLEALQAQGLVDELVEYTVVPELEPSINELNKRNFGLQRALTRGCEYFMTMDCDECWLPDELAKAKTFLIKHGITHAYSPIKAYGPLPTELHIRLNTCFAPFFCKVNGDSFLDPNNNNVPCVIDPTRKVSHRDDACYFVLHMVNMHHMTFVRKNLKLKYRYTSYNDGENRHSNVTFDKDMLGERVTVDDYFSILPLLEAQDGVVNTP